MRKDIVALILENEGKFLVEKRKNSKSTVPGSVIFPAGHVELVESNEQALIREMKEELNIDVYGLKLIYSSDFDCEEKQRIYWYSCNDYKGKIENHEADFLFWIEPSEIETLTHEISRNALKAYISKKY